MSHTFLYRFLAKISFFRGYRLSFPSDYALSSYGLILQDTPSVETSIESCPDCRDKVLQRDIHPVDLRSLFPPHARGHVLLDALADGVPKVAKGCSEGFCHFWHPRTLRISKVHFRQGYVGGGDSTQDRLWLEALKNLEEGTSQGEKGRINVVLSSVDEASKFPNQEGARAPKALIGGNRLY